MRNRESWGQQGGFEEARSVWGAGRDREGQGEPCISTL